MKNQSSGHWASIVVAIITVIGAIVAAILSRGSGERAAIEVVIAATMTAEAKLLSTATIETNIEISSTITKDLVSLTPIITPSPTNIDEPPIPTATIIAQEPQQIPTATTLSKDVVYKCNNKISCIEILPNLPIRIGYMLVTSGLNASLGIDARNGIEIALDMKKEVLGHPLELIGEDAACTPDGGKFAAHELISDKDIIAIVGTSCSSEARGGATILSDAGFTMLSPSATAPDLTNPTQHVEGFLRVSHNDKVQGAVAAKFVFDRLKLSRVAAIHDGSPYSQGIVNTFIDEFVGMGGEIVAIEGVSPTDSDMRPVLRKIALKKPQVLYYPVFTKSGVQISVQSNEIEGLNTGIIKIGSDGLFSPEFITSSGAAVEGMYLSSPDFSQFDSEYTTNFLPAYHKKFGSSPISSFHAHAYDATNMIFAAIEKTAMKNTDGSLIIERFPLRDAIYATQNFHGLTGNITCNANGDCSDPYIVIYQITRENITNGEAPTLKVYP